MRYLTFDGKKYISLDDGIAYDVRWDNTASKWREVWSRTHTRILPTQ